MYLLFLCPKCYSLQVFVVPAIIAMNMLQQASLTKTANHRSIAFIYGMALILIFSVSAAFHVVSLIGKFR